jgi:hypothetical protein
MKNQNPSIHITYADQLQHVKLAAQPDTKVLSFDEAENKAEEYRQAWAQKELLVLDGIQDCMGLRFDTPVIDVALAPWTYGSAISFPLIVDMARDPDEFVDVLTHELIHHLFSDNQIMTSRHARAQSRLKWNELFGDEHSGSTLVHIAVHAVLKYIYLDVHHEPYRLQRDIDHAKKLPDYARAWDYVEGNDYKGIIEQLKRRYGELAIENS